MKAEQLENLKLITDESVYLPEEKVLEQVELSVQQGAGGWGVRTLDGVILTLARDLRGALVGAEALDETKRTLKGLQLENGRLKKRLDAKDAEIRSNLSVINEQANALVEHRETIHELEAGFAEMAGVDKCSDSE